MKTTKVFTVESLKGGPAFVAATVHRRFDGDRPARILWESDFKALMRIVRLVADEPCVCLATCQWNCSSCLARKLLARKETKK